MSTVVTLFVLFIVLTLGITYWAARLSRGTNAFFVANRQFSGWQNGIAIAGDYMSAASFLGIAGIIAFQGYGGFMYSVGWLVAYLLVLPVVEPLRNSGKYTMADVLAYRLRARPVRAMAALSTLTVSTFCMVVQVVGAGALVTLLLKGSGISYNQAVVCVGVLMTVYVVFGGMLATTWVQIVKAVLLVSLAEMNYQRGTLRSAVEILAKAVERLKVAQARSNGSGGCTPRRVRGEAAPLAGEGPGQGAVAVRAYLRPSPIPARTPPRQLARPHLRGMPAPVRTAGATRRCSPRDRWLRDRAYHPSRWRAAARDTGRGLCRRGQSAHGCPAGGRNG